jgi:Tetratricopeptide repeat
MPIPQTPLAEGMGSDMPPSAISPVQPPAVSSPQTEVVAVAPSVSMAAVAPELGQGASIAAPGPDDGKPPLDPQIVSARQAYARKQYQDAIGIYRAYISRHNDNASAFGELGNVLLAAGRPQEAAQAYYEASSRLIDVGQPGSVYLLLPHIEQQDPLLAAVLTRRLASLPRAYN